MAVSTWSAASSKRSPVSAARPVVVAVGELDHAGAPSPAPRIGAAFGDDADARARRELLLVAARPHPLAAAAVDDRHLLGAELLRLHAGVDRGHAAADHHHPPPDRQRRRDRRPGAARR